MVAEYATDEEIGMEDDREALQARTSALLQRLGKEAEERVQQRHDVEQRWLEDLRQYHGRYDPKTEADLTKAKQSRLFINQTRPKTNSCEARLADMLFPTDDRNWGVKPTPVPEMSAAAEEAAHQAREAKQAAQEAPKEDPNAQAQAKQVADQAQQASDQLHETLKEARLRAEAMEEEIADHLKECRYDIQSRDVIHDACKLGTGIMKGPVVGGKPKRRWMDRPVKDEMTGQPMMGQDGQPMMERSLVSAPNDRPAFWRVDPWHFFPDSDARSMDECESVFERHLLKKKGLRDLAKTPGFNADAIRELIRDGGTKALPTYLSDLRTISRSGDTSTLDERYVVWEYHGPLPVENLRELASITGDDTMLDDIGLDSDEIDPLMDVPCQIWFCDGHLLKLGIHPLDSGDPVYSVFCLERDEAGVFGFGIPYLMRDAQRAMNAAWRTMMDNAGLSSGPQIVVNQDVVQPADGDWTLSPRKVWRRNSGVAPNERAFETFNIQSNQVEFANIVQMAKQNIDDETSIPVIAQGEQGTHTTQTAHGMTMLMNSVNVVFRRIIKNFDDDMTTPNVRRIYDWLMQFSDKEEIKGDYEVDARGSSVLLVREMQSANMMALLNAFAAHPTLGPSLKQGGLPALRMLIRMMMIVPDEIVKTDAELEEEQAAMRDAPPEPNPEVMRHEVALQIKQLELQGKERIALLDRETELMKLANTMNIKQNELSAFMQKNIAELDAKQREAEAERQAKDRRMATEAAMTERAWGLNKSTAGGTM